MVEEVETVMRLPSPPLSPLSSEELYAAAVASDSDSIDRSG